MEAPRRWGGVWGGVFPPQWGGVREGAVPLSRKMFQISLIALRLNEWPTFKQAVDKLHCDNPTVANFTPCFLNVDHTTPEIIVTCPECNPYPSTIA